MLEPLIQAFGGIGFAKLISLLKKYIKVIRCSYFICCQKYKFRMNNFLLISHSVRVKCQYLKNSRGQAKYAQNFAMIIYFLSYTYYSLTSFLNIHKQFYLCRIVYVYHVCYSVKCFLLLWLLLQKFVFNQCYNIYFFVRMGILIISDQRENDGFFQILYELI